MAQKVPKYEKINPGSNIFDVKHYKNRNHINYDIVADNPDTKMIELEFENPSEVAICFENRGMYRESLFPEVAEFMKDHINKIVKIKCWESTGEVVSMVDVVGRVIKLNDVLVTVSANGTNIDIDLSDIIQHQE